jgi:hypothetical protein
VVRFARLSYRPVRELGVPSVCAAFGGNQMPITWSLNGLFVMKRGEVPLTAP